MTFLTSWLALLLLFGAVSIFYIWALEAEETGFFGVLLGGGLIGAYLAWSGIITPHLTLLNVAVVGAVYIVGALIWALIKWKMFLSEARENYINTDIKAYLDTKYFYGGPRKESAKLDEIYPTTTRHKERIMKWMILWPWSLFWTCTGDLFNQMFSFLKTSMDQMAKHAFKDLK